MRFRVVGWDQRKEEETELVVGARNPRAAERKVRRRDVVPRWVTPLPENPPAPPPPATPTGRPGWSGSEVAWMLGIPAGIAAASALSFMLDVWQAGLLFGFAAVGSVYVLLAELPPRFAKRCGHSKTYVNVVRACAWLGLAYTGGLLWLLAVVLAYAPPKDVPLR